MLTLKESSPENNSLDYADGFLWPAGNSFYRVMASGGSEPGI